MKARTILRELLGLADAWRDAAGLKASNPADYDAVRNIYLDELTAAFDTYLDGGTARGPKSAAGRAVLEAVADAIEGAFAEAEAELDDDDRAWLRESQSTQRAYLDGVFEWIKDGKAADTAAREEASLAGRDIPDKTMTEDAIAGRVELWGNGLDGIRSEAVLRASKNVMLEFDGDDGEESCATCQKLKGTRRSTKWVLANDMIPRPGNENFDCKGYRCQHFWKNAKTGEQVTF